MPTPKLKRHDNWLHEEILCVIEQFKSNYHILRKNKRNQVVYKAIMEILRKNGFQRSSAEVQKKIQNMKRRYRLEKEKLDAGDETVPQWLYYDKFKDAMENAPTANQEELSSMLFEENEQESSEKEHVEMDFSVSEQEPTSEETPLSQDPQEPLLKVKEENNTSSRLILLKSGGSTVAVPIEETPLLKDEETNKEIAKVPQSYRLVKLPLHNMPQLKSVYSIANKEKENNDSSKVTPEATVTLPVIKIIQQPTPAASTQGVKNKIEQTGTPQNSNLKSFLGKAPKKKFGIVADLLEECYQSQQEHRQHSREMTRLMKQSVENQNRIINLLEENNRLLRSFQ